MWSTRIIEDSAEPVESIESPKSNDNENEKMKDVLKISTVYEDKYMRRTVIIPTCYPEIDLNRKHDCCGIPG